MKLSDMEMPTTVDSVHESCYRSYHCLAKVKDLLEQKCPPDVILEIIEDIKTAPQGEKKL